MGAVGLVLIVLGTALALVGAALLVAEHLGLGSLPGDIRVQSGNLTVYAPCATMLILSILLTIALNIIARLLNR